MMRRAFLIGIAVGSAAATSGCLNEFDQPGDGEADQEITQIWIRNGTGENLSVDVYSISNQEEEPLMEKSEIDSDSVETTETDVEPGEHTIKVVYDGQDTEEEVTIQREGRLEISVSDPSPRIEFVQDEPQ
jgi:hypothetical protein